MLTFDLGVGIFFTVSNVNEIERSLGLGEADGKVLHLANVDSPFTLHRPGQSINVSVCLDHDLNVTSIAFTYASDGRAKSISSPLAALNALGDPMFLEL
jgi:hypothetical protein